MGAIETNDLPVGHVCVDQDGRVVTANQVFCEWAETASPLGRKLSDFLVPVEDFLEGGQALGMMARPDRPERAAFVIPAADGVSFVVIDASERYAAGRELRSARSLSDRTRTRLQLVIDASIAFARATTEERLAEILAGTAALAYRAEESVVYLIDDVGRLRLTAGADPFADADGGDSATGVDRLDAVFKVSGTAEAAALDPQLAARMDRTGVQSLIAAPLHHDGQTLGVFACFFHHPRQFDEEAAPLADALAGQAAQTLTTIRLQQQLEHAAMHDETTGLPNRRRLEEVSSSTAPDRSMAVMFIDLDGFKAVNDRFGHSVGDEVLREVAERLRTNVREEDLVARYGGDEFVVVCELVGEEVIGEVAERLGEALGAPYRQIPTHVTLGASIGVAIGSLEAGGWSIDGLIRRADQAMYAAKSAGGHQIILG